MERKCSQTIKIPFPARVFYGTEITVNIPKSGDLIKNIRLVLDFPNTPNTLGERIIEKTDLLIGEKSIESLEGEYIHVENTFTVPVEKYDKLNQLLCVTNTGTMYLDIPFKSTSDYGLYLTDDTTRIRILFANQTPSSELFGHVLVDYYLIEKPQKFPYVQNVIQIQKFRKIVTNPKKLKMSVYAVGPVYQLYFTVKDTSTNTYVDAITNICLNFGEKERFNLTGQYLRYVEPLKILNTYSTEPMYMYSFCLNPNVPSGSTHFNEKSFFLIDFYDNQSTYEVTIWAKSHDFVYVTEKTIKPIFESTEMLIDTTKNDVSSYQNVPLRVSYINYSGSIVIFYSSPYEISNINVQTNTSNYIVTQNAIEFNNIDSVFGEYTANVIFSATGFSDTTCYFRFLGNNLYLDKILYTGDGFVPTHIDLGQKFHYLYGNVFDFSSNVFTSNIQSLTIDENKNYAFTTYTTSTSSILGASTSFTGPGSIIAKYNEDMNLLFTVTATNSNVTELSTGNTYGVYSGSQGRIVSRDYGTSINASAGSATVFIDYASPTFSILRFSSSPSIITIGNTTSSFGLNTDRFCMFTNNSIPVIISNIRQVKTSLDFFSNGNPVFACMISNTSSGIGVSVPSSTNGYLLSSLSWTKTISNVSSSSIINTIVKTDKMTNSVYLIGGYDNTTPILSGFTFINGTGAFAIKFDSSGNVKYVLSFIGNITQVYPVLDDTTGRFMISLVTQTASVLRMYNNGILKYTGAGKYQMFVIDDFGNINSYAKDLNELFGIQKPSYFNPLCNYEFFKKYYQPVPSNTIWNCFLTGSANRTFGGYSLDPNTNDLYSLVTCTGTSFSNITDKYGDTNVSFTNIAGPMTAYVVKINSNCVYSNTLIRATNLRDEVVTNVSKSNNIYVLLNTNSSGNVIINDKNGNTVLTIPVTSNSLLLVKFNTDGTYSNWYIIIPNSTGNSVITDINGNIYINALKLSTSSLNINDNNGFTVGVVPSTTKSSCYIVKFNSSDVFSWVSYIDGSGSCSSSVDSNGNVFLAASKSASVISNINGSGINTVPSTTQSSCYIVKFNSSGVYANWYCQLSTNVFNSGCSSTQIKTTSTGAPVWYTYLGYINAADSTSSLDFTLSINGVGVKTIKKQRAASDCLIKFTSDSLPAYDWTVRGGVDPYSPNNFTKNTGDLSVDQLDNFIITSTRQPYAYYIYDKNVDPSSSFPGSPTMTIPASCNESGLLFKINNDGTVDNDNYVYIDSTGNDVMSKCLYDKNGDIFVTGYCPSTSKYMSFFDKTGYAGVLNSFYDNVTYGFLFKINANIKINKISL